MGSYSKNTIPQTNTGSSVSHFPWLYAENYMKYCCTTSKPALDSLQGIQVNSEPGIAIAPIRSIPPTKESVENNVSGIKTTEAGKQKSSLKPANRDAAKALKPKQPKKKPSTNKKAKGPVIPETKREKKNLNIDVDVSNLDFSGVPSPVCSCTGVPRVCYKWGAGGWQSSCCTISISEYPLPMSSTRPGARVAGRKMSNGAYLKLLLRLGTEGHDLSLPVDLKHHWARHGTNKFVTIK
ncbi:hypothetical protein SLA2020_520590 [Shorea laevis]